MLRSWSRRFLSAGEIDTPGGRALVEERYATLRRQVPIVYMLAAVNLFGLQVTSVGHLDLGWNVPTAVAICAVIRIIQWVRSPDAASHGVMLRRMSQSMWLTLAISMSVFVWCFHLLEGHPEGPHMAVMLFGGLTAVGVSYGLSPLPAAARIPLLVIALPLAALAITSSNPQFVGAALSISFIALLLLRLLGVNNAHFTALVRSRAMIARQQELAESAREEAIVAATTDFLTCLPNRRAFVAALEAQFEKGDTSAFAVGILDLDRFKVINDTFGHATGDRLLASVANRLRSAARENVLVARLGGDEFGLLLCGVRTAKQAESAAKTILTGVNGNVVVDGRSFGVSLCCGIAIAGRRRERTPSRVLADADLALYEAKERTGGGVAIFDAWMEAPRRRRVQIERALQTPGAVERIELVYQPIFDIRSGKLIANEALARWADDELGPIPPAEFIPIAEQLNLIGRVTSHLMGKAFRDAASWPESVRLSFNLSAVDLSAANSAALVLAALRKAALPTARLQVEVTETALLRDLQRARQNLAALSDAGVTVVLDDFGAGYASIGYLKELRFDQIKLDGGLLTAAMDSPDGERLLSAVIGLCNALGVEPVAEHVEREEQLKLLLRLGCGAGQGFWLAKPMSAEESRAFSNAVARLPGQRQRVEAPVRA